MACQRSLVLVALCAMLTVASARSLLAVYVATGTDCTSAQTNCNTFCGGSDNVSSFDCTAPTSTSEASGECYCDNGSGGSYNEDCFAGASTATTPSGPVAMADLELGTEVLTVTPSGALEFKPVFMFTSRRAAKVTTFVRLSTSAGPAITVTPGHYMFASKDASADVSALHSWSYVAPRDIAIGDTVPVVVNSQLVSATVTGKEMITETGVYMPHTASGAIVVDGVVATELTQRVPALLAGKATHTALVTVMRLAQAVLPQAVETYLLNTVSECMHGARDMVSDRAALSNSLVARS